MDTYTTIPLTQGKVAIVDMSDYDWLSHWNWSAHRCDDKWYALRYIRLGKSDYGYLYMHRAILEAPDSLQVDHRNRNGLDNRRENLRLATHSQNLWNRGDYINNTSGHKGVYWSKEKGKFYARITVNGKVKNLGYFLLLDDAANARDAAVREFHGDFAPMELR